LHPFDARSALAGTFAGNSVILLSGIVTGILVARLLGPANRGALAAVLFWPQLIAALTFLSLNEATVLQVGQQPARAARIGTAALLAAIVLAVIASSVAYLILPGLLGAERANLWATARLYAVVSLPFQYVFLARNAVDWGRLRFAPHNQFRVAVPLLYLLGLIILAATHRITVVSAAMASLAAVIIGAVIRVSVGWTAIDWQLDASAIKQLLRTGWSFHGITVLLALSTQIDRLVVIRLFNDSIVGYYMVAFTVASAGLGAIGAAFSRVLLPTLASAGSDRRAQARILSRGIRTAMLLLFVAGAALAVVAPQLVVLLFGHRFAPAGPLVRWLLLAYWLAGVREIVVYSIRGLGEARTGTIAQALMLGSFLLVAWPAIGRWGLPGLVGSLIIANIIAAAYLFTFLRREYSLAAPELWGIRPKTVRELMWQVRLWRS
jgi:O-antigen/teichoic acid export membrane protein